MLLFFSNSFNNLVFSSSTYLSISSFENCDVILVLQDGQLTEMGSHEQLMALNGYYKTVWTEQNEV